MPWPSPDDPWVPVELPDGGGFRPWLWQRMHGSTLVAFSRLCGRDEAELRRWRSIVVFTAVLTVDEVVTAVDGSGWSSLYASDDLLETPKAMQEFLAAMRGEA